MGHKSKKMCSTVQRQRQRRRQLKQQQRELRQ